MDVACPRCSTEYEFDESRIPVDGVTVKCTQCSHVFRIKRRASAFSTEVSQPGRDWKLRYVDGRVEAFQKLTVLHQWIVERRVSRNDEVSLSGETWKRLGDIAELASFFTIVDEAERGRGARGEVKTQPEAYAQPAPAPHPPPLPLHPHPEPNTKETLRGGQFAPLPAAPSAAKTLPPDAPDPLKETLKQPTFVAPAPPPPPTDMTPAPSPLPEPEPPPVAAAPPPPAPPQPARHNTLSPQAMRVQSAARNARPRPMPSDEELFTAAKGGSGGGGKWLGLFLLLLGLGGAAGYYFLVWQPQQEQLALDRKAEADAAEAKRKADAAKAAEEEKARQQAEAKKKEEEEKAKTAALPAADAGPADAGVAVAEAPDAGARADAGTKAVAKAPRDFDQWMALGDRLRSADKAEQALNAYGEAADMKPDRVEPIAGRGLALLDMGKQLQAEASFQQALKLNNRYGPALMGLAETYRYQSKNDKAIEYYQKYLDVLPDGPEANVARTQIERLKKAQ